MKISLKKRGQKIIRRFSRASRRAGEESKEHLRENFIERISHIRNIKLLIFEWSLLVAALIMLGIAQAFWFGESYAKDVFVSGGNYIEATIGRVNSLNPLFATSSSEKTLSRLMFSTLATVDYSGHVGPSLAKTIYTNGDGSVWTLHLKDGLRWSDGEPLTNEDVMFTVGLIQNPAAGTVYSANLDSVKVEEQPNGDITFTLVAPYADFISALDFPIVPKHKLQDAPVKTLIEDDFSNSPVTSGAFMFNASQGSISENERVFYLSANPNFYLGKPMINSFAVHVYTNKDDVVSAINAGSVTATSELSGEDIDRVTSANFYKKNASINSGVFIFFNMSNQVLSNASVRRAIREGVDIEKLKNIAPDTKALYYPLTTEQIQLSQYPKLPEYNLESAKATLSKLTSDKEISLDITTVSSGYLPAVANDLSTQLNELGFETRVNTYSESQDFVANILSKRQYDILVYEIPLGADPDVLAYYHSSQASMTGLNLSNYRNSLVDDLLIGARETLDASLRAKKYEFFLEYWVNDAPAIGLYQPNMTYIYNKNVRPFGDNVHLVTALDRFADITEWAVVKGVKNLTP